MIKRISSFIGTGARAFVALVGVAGISLAVANYSVTQGSGTTFGSVVVGGVHYAQQFLCDLTTPSQCATVDSSGRVAAAIASGADVTTGATGDAASSAGGTGTVSAKLRLMTTQLDTINTTLGGSIPAGTNLIGDVNLRQGGTALSATNGAYTNVLQGNAVLSVSNPSFTALAPTTTQGCTSNTVVTAAASTNATNVKASAGTLCDFTATNEHTAIQYVHFYNTAGSPTCNASIVATYAIPPASAAGQLGGLNIPWTFGRAFATGIGFCITANRDGTGNATANGILLNIGYK